MRRVALASIIISVAILAAVWVARERAREPAPPAPGALPERAEFVGAKTCRTCHEERHETWLATAHAHALRAPDPTSIAGRFDGQPVEAKTFVATPSRRDDGYYVRVDGKDGRAPGNYRVTRVIGRAFEQAYLYSGPRGAWHVLPVCWSVERQEWDLTHEVLEDITAGIDGIGEDFDTRALVFNHECGQCHATDYDVGHAWGPSGEHTYATTFLEGAVACESCHGPGSVHTAWHDQDRGTDADYETPARLLHPERDLDAKGVLASCGRCHYAHMWVYALDADPRVTRHDVARTRNFDRPGFFADGRLSSMNYHGTTQSQSACFSKGEMSCLSCHGMHAGRRWALKWNEDDDRQCTQCHEAGTYASERHTFHADVRCVDCHMPKLIPEGRVRHFMRDHSVHSPEPELTERFGRDHAPNACDACHKDKTATWAREWKEKWWGPAPRRIVEDVGTVVALRTAPEQVATASLVQLALRKESRRFFRATALRRLAERADAEEARAALRALLAAPDPELVQLACEVLGARPDPAAGPALLPLLRHPVRTVRVDAAYALARAGWRGSADGLWADAVGMLERQHPFPAVLERIAYIADALGKPGELGRYLNELLRGTPQAPVDLLQRHARSLTEAGLHVEALVQLDQVRQLLPRDRPLPKLLFLDSADSLAAVGQMEDATENWRYLVAEAEAGSVLHAVAAARLAALRDEKQTALRSLEELAARLAGDPTSGEKLRRVRWSVERLRGE
ncbi:MAG: HEAT repeat domain-containing protein [Planctomycetota bacterium]